MIVILYFSWLHDIIGKHTETMTIPDTVKDISGLIAFLSKQGNDYEKAFYDLDAIKCARNCELVTMEECIKEGDEIAFFPPFTGG